VTRAIAAPPSPTRPPPVVVAGLGNIGSQVADLLVGLGLRSVHFVDPDRYEASNVGHQRVRERDVGRPKARVQARYLRSLAPGLSVTPWVRSVEAVPAGYLRGAVILACVDSRWARQAINHLAFALGSPWIDAAIEARGLIKVRGFQPGGPCLECGWGQEDYAALEQRYPCQPGPAVTARTNAPAELGAAAAAIQVALLRGLLAGADPDALTAQWCLDLAHRHAFAARFEVNPRCLHDHRPWAIAPLAAGAAALTLGAAFALVSADGPASLSVDGQVFVRRTRCLRCGHLGRSGLRLSERAPIRACPACGGPLRATGADVIDALVRARIPGAWLGQPLAAFGFEEHDIFAVTGGDGEIRCFELGAAEGSG